MGEQAVLCLLWVWVQLGACLLLVTVREVSCCLHPALEVRELTHGVPARVTLEQINLMTGAGRKEPGARAPEQGAKGHWCSYYRGGGRMSWFRVLQL